MPSRRALLRTAGATGLGSLGLATVSAAAGERQLSFRIVRDESAERSDPFHRAAVRGVTDFGTWLEAYAPGVERVTVSRAAEAIESLSADGPLEHARAELPDDWQQSATATVVLTTNPELRLGRSNGQLYDGGTVCHVNANHTGLPGATGSAFGYTMAIHELAHGQTFLGGPGGRDDHALGDPRVETRSGETAAFPTIFAAGYAHAVQDSDATPSSGCGGDEWAQHHRSRPRPAFTACACRELFNYHSGERDAFDDAEFDGPTNVSLLESPTGDRVPGEARLRRWAGRLDTHRGE